MERLLEDKTGPKLTKFTKKVRKATFGFVAVVNRQRFVPLTMMDPGI